MSAKKNIIFPYIPESFLYGDIVSWKFRNGVTPVKGKYCYRLTINFANCPGHEYQQGGFKTEAEAIKAKEMAIAALHKGNFIPYSYTTKEFYDFWLYYEMLKKEKLTYNSFFVYRNIVYNYIVVYFKKKKVNDITGEEVIAFLDTVKSESIFSLCCTVLRSSFDYAVNHKIISSNPVSFAIRASKKKRRLEAEVSEKKREPTMSPQNIAKILLLCKESLPEYYPMLLIAVTTGIRKNEMLALKYSDIDMFNKCLIISKQIGRKINLDDGTISWGEQELKTRNSYRKVPLPDFVIDELIITRRTYEKNRDRIFGFHDENLICCSKDGKALPQKCPGLILDYLLEENNLPHIRWHDLRHVYATTLANNDVNMKAISDFLGHATPDFTQKIYVDPAPEEPIFNAVQYIEQYIEDLVHGEPSLPLIGISDSYIQSLLEPGDEEEVEETNSDSCATVSI